MNRQLELVKTIYEQGQLDLLDQPQIALAGRSNVGKSSLVNCLGGRKKLAKISSTPGKTRSLNYYLVHPDEFYLVDLPGYGYARCSKAERAKWGQLIEAYIQQSSGLRAVAVLLDCRLTPQKNDLEMTTWLDHLGIRLLAVLTKADKVKQAERAKRQKQWKDILRLDKKPLLFSSQNGLGRAELWNLLAETVSAPGDEA